MHLIFLYIFVSEIFSNLIKGTSFIKRHNIIETCVNYKDKFFFTIEIIILYC